MTAPVVTANNVMQFVMPDKYKELSQLPTPLDSRVTLKQVPVTYTHGTHAQHMYTLRAAFFRSRMFCAGS
jgi:hypothetical protein